MSEHPANKRWLPATHYAAPQAYSCSSSWLLVFARLCPHVARSLPYDFFLDTSATRTRIDITRRKMGYPNGKGCRLMPCNHRHYSFPCMHTRSAQDCLGNHDMNEYLTHKRSTFYGESIVCVCCVPTIKRLIIVESHNQEIVESAGYQLRSSRHWSKRRDTTFLRLWEPRSKS